MELGLLLSNVVAMSVIGFHGISDRIIIVKLFSKPFNLSILQVYAPTSASSEEEIEAFYNDLDDAYKQCDSQEMVRFERESWHRTRPTESCCRTTWSWRAQ